MKRFAAWVTNYKKKLNGSLTIKTYLVLLALLLVICSITYMLISLFLPFMNQGQSRSELNTQSKALVEQLRRCHTYESGDLFAGFMQVTGADLYLLDEKYEPVDLFTFTITHKTIEPGLEYPFRFIGSDKEYILVVRLSTARSEEINHALRRSLPWIGGLILLISLFGAFFISRYATRPIVRMSKTAANIADLDFSWYCPDLREDEIGVLAKSINELSDKLNTALSSLRRQNSSLENEIALEKERERKRMLFFSAVSHELKTPIAIVIGQLEGMQAGIGVYKDRSKYIARSADILRSLDGFIKEIISVSYIDISEKKVQTPVDLSDLLETVLGDSSTFMDARTIQLHIEIEPAIIILGDAVLLKKALKNVIDNAVLHSPMGSPVSVWLMSKDDKAELTIANGGAHIAKEHLPHLFDAFYRGDRHTGGYPQGSGLGLYITRIILESHQVIHSIKNQDDGVQFTALFQAAKTPHKKHNTSSCLQKVSDKIDGRNPDSASFLH